MPADRKKGLDEAREKLIGLGKRSIGKSYYPELRERVDELEHFRALLDRVSDAIFVMDADSGLIVDISGSTRAMLGCNASSLVGTLFKLLLPEHIKRHADSLFLGGSKKIRIETELFPPAGGENGVPVDISLQLVSLHDKRRAIIVARDISERKRSEEALKKSHDLLEIRVRERTRELAQANKAKSEFLSVVSHELRTPLTSLLGFAKVIRRRLNKTIFPLIEKGDPKVDKAISQICENMDIIASEGDRLTALINDVLDLAKLEANKIGYKMAPVSPEEFINRAVQATSSLIEDSGLIPLMDIEAGLPEVRGDLDRLIQVMVNLISNAVKFTSEGTISFRARLVGDNVQVSVSDTGIGIPESKRAAIFDKFTQADESLSDRPRGTGLGLAICRNIVNGHGGHIWVESDERQGSTFVFTLPLPKPKSRFRKASSPEKVAGKP